MSGGKGGSKTSQVEIPKWVEGPAKINLERASQAAMLGPITYGGPDVAALTPMQVQGMQATADAAAAMGLGPATNVAASLPQATNYGGGMIGYSAMPLYEQALAQWKASSPGQAEAYSNMFINPQTGELPQWYTDMVAAQQNATQSTGNSGINTGVGYVSDDEPREGGGGSGGFNSGGGYQGGGWSDPANSTTWA